METNADLEKLEIGGVPWLRADKVTTGDAVEGEFFAVEMTRTPKAEFPSFLWKGTDGVFAKVSGYSLITGVKMFVADFVGKKARLTSNGRKWLVKFL